MKILLTALLCLMIVSCKSAPDKADYQTDECYYHAYCMYINDENPAACSGLEKACCDSLMEERIKDRIKYCTDSRPTDWTFKECFLQLNQK